MSDLQYFSDFSLQGLNTLALPCEAAIFFPADDNESVLEAIGLSKDLALPIMVIGGGSNLVLPPKMPALVLQYSGSNIELIEDADRVLIEVSAGVNWHQLVEYTLDQGWFG
ncbi:MAG: FAD-binding protein, partial [bacterium]